MKVAMRANSLVTAFLLLKSSCDFVSHGCICYYVAFDLLFCCHPVFVVLGYPKLPFGRPRGSILAPWGAILTPCCCSRGSWGRPKGHLGVHISIFANFFCRCWVPPGTRFLMVFVLWGCNLVTKLALRVRTLFFSASGMEITLEADARMCIKHSKY